MIGRIMSLFVFLFCSRVYDEAKKQRRQVSEVRK